MYIQTQGQSYKGSVTCSVERECSLLMQATLTWLKNYSRFPVGVNTTSYIDSLNPEPGKHSYQAQYRIFLEKNEIIVQVFCEEDENCHAVTDGVHNLTSFLEERKERINDNLPIVLEKKGTSLGDILLGGESSEVEDSFDRIQMTPDRITGTYEKSIAKTLPEMGCDKLSDIVLLKIEGGRELYEINCLKDVEQIVLDCDKGGCKIIR
ncbi:MAG: hypothetical protein VX237_08135 [Chloroflexota bacterium]|nr:hypothetical protein [Chloroflexota bacterium]